MLFPPTVGIAQQDVKGLSKAFVVINQIINYMLDIIHGFMASNVFVSW